MPIAWLRKQVYSIAPLRLFYAGLNHLRRRPGVGLLSDANALPPDGSGTDTGLAEIELPSGLKFYVYPSDQKGQRYLRRLDLSTDLHRIWRYAAHHYDIFVDAGANYGEYLLVLIEEGVLPDRQTHAFEPNPAVIAAQRRTLAAAGVVDAVHSHRKGLSDQPGTSTFYINKDDSGASSTRALTAINPARGIYLDRQQIEVDSGDRLLGSEIGPQTRIAIKIDTEGHDFRVVAGFRESLLRCEAYYLALECDRRGFQRGLQILGPDLSERLFGGDYFVYYHDRLHACHGTASALAHYQNVANNIDLVVSNDPATLSFIQGLLNSAEP